MSQDKVPALRAIPSVDQLLHTEAAVRLRESVGPIYLTQMARDITDDMRTELRAESRTSQTRETLLQQAAERLETRAYRESLSGIRRVINATGVILHTNLGRAPLSQAAREAVIAAAGYCTLEYEANNGKRGKRGDRAENLLVQLTGAEAALIVNNCASAALLILTVLASEGETVVSRGELVEIGGDFRVPDVMSNSGTRMIEVGSTNRTRLADYQQAINENTRVIMRVHPSNFRIVGFTDSPSLTELASLAHSSGLILYEDAGSGALADLTNYGLADEPVISNSIAAGADVVSFSGDKLLGGTQAGLIVGSRTVIDRLRKHSLYRALRADKLCLAALEVTLEAHRRGALDEIPTLRMLKLTVESIEPRARVLAEDLSRISGLTATVVPGHSAVGGGSGPNAKLSTALVALKHSHLNASELEANLRHSTPPVIARISDGSVLIDLRTVEPNEEPALLRALKSLTFPENPSENL